MWERDAYKYSLIQVLKINYTMELFHFANKLYNGTIKFFSVGDKASCEFRFLWLV